MSTNLFWPVKSGWHLLQISTRIEGSVEPVVKVSPQAQVTLASGNQVGCRLAFMFLNVFKKTRFCERELQYFITKREAGPYIRRPRRELNPRPLGPEPNVLSAELRGQH